jgi:hypothetical protein
MAREQSPRPVAWPKPRAGQSLHPGRAQGKIGGGMGTPERRPLGLLDNPAATLYNHERAAQWGRGPCPDLWARPPPAPGRGSGKGRRRARPPGSKAERRGRAARSRPSRGHRPAWDGWPLGQSMIGLVQDGRRGPLPPCPWRKTPTAPVPGSRHPGDGFPSCRPDRPLLAECLLAGASDCPRAGARGNPGRTGRRPALRGPRPAELVPGLPRLDGIMAAFAGKLTGPRSSPRPSPTGVGRHSFPGPKPGASCRGLP